MAVDGTLHVVTGFLEGLARGLSRDDAVAATLGRCGPALWQTSLAIGVGLLMLYPAELLLVSRFGWLMAALIGTAFVADAVLLSALLAGPLGLVLEHAMQLRSSDVASTRSAATTERATAETAASGPHFLASIPPSQHPLQAD